MLVLGRDIVDEAEFFASLDQADECVLHAVKTTSVWQTFSAAKVV
jgi:hypothetical protein